MVHSGLSGLLPIATATDTWVWQRARTEYGLFIHEILLKLVLCLAKPERFDLVAADGQWLKKHHPEMKAAFSRICEVALQGTDAAFFHQIGECINFINRPPGHGDQAAEKFKNAIMYKYLGAKQARFDKDREAGTLRKDLPDHEVFWHTHPSWHDVDDAIREGFSKYCPEDDPLFEFSKKDSENRRKQIEDALKALGLPFAQKRQVR